MALPQTHEEAKTVPDAWDYKGSKAQKSATGGWRSAAMILGVEGCERLTTLGIAINLVTYMTGTMHLGNATSANTVTNFLGTSYMLCLLGGFTADTYLGRYLTIAIFAPVQAMGATLLAVSTIVPGLRPPKCVPGSNSCVPASGNKLVILYMALYLTAFGTGGIKSSVSGFGSDQFDDTDQKEKTGMIKFFNWFYFFINVGSICAVTILVYIQDDVGRAWGYGICAFAVVVGWMVFVLGTRRYRFKKLESSPLTQVASVFVAAMRKRHLEMPSDPSLLFDVDDIPMEAHHKKKQRLTHSKQFRFLDKASIMDAQIPTDLNMINKWQLSTLTDVEEVKQVIRMLPIWATTIMFWTIHAQMITFSVAQASTLQRKVNSFEIPSAAMAGFFVGSILLTVAIYDRFVVPICRTLLKNPNGLTPLQRVAGGLFLSIVSMAVAAGVELKRLRVARLHGLTNNDVTPVPLSVFWIVPQFSIVGAGEAFIYLGQLDFFLRECPKGMKTMSTGLFLSTLSLGFFYSSVLVSIVDKVTGSKKAWLADNLNQGKLYNFYWLLAILSALNLMAFMVCAKWYVYKEKRLADEGIELEESQGPTFH